MWCSRKKDRQFAGSPGGHRLVWWAVVMCCITIVATTRGGWADGATTRPPANVRAYTKQLADGDAKARAVAADRLGRTKNASAVAPLLTALNDPDPLVRERAARSLRLLRDPKAVPALAAMLGKGKAQPTDEIVWALGAIGSPAVPKLLTAAGSHDGATRIDALTALSYTHDPAACGTLLAALDDSDPGVQAAAVKGLGRLRCPGATGLLIAKLETSGSQLRSEAARSLELMRDPTGTRALVRVAMDPDQPDDLRASVVLALAEPWHRSAVGALIELMEERPKLRTDAAVALGATRDPRAITALLGKLFSPDPEFARTVRSALGSARNSVVVPCIAALGHEDASMRLAAAITLAGVTDGRSVAPLVAALGDADSLVRVAAADALAKQRSPRATTPLIAALKDADRHVRRSAAAALGQIRDPRCVEALIGLTSDTDSGVRQAAVDALGAMKSPKTASVLARLLKDEEPGVRASAARALANSDRKLSVPALVAALRDERPPVREASAQSLGKLKAEGAAHQLITAAEDSDESVQAAAIKALACIGDRRATGVLTQKLSSENPRIRQEAAQALGYLRNPQAVGALARLLLDRKSNSEWVRHSAAVALGRSHSPAALDPLLEALDDPDGYAHDGVVHGLGLLGDKRAIPALISVVNDRHGESRCNAGWALAQMIDGRVERVLMRALDEFDLEVISGAAEFYIRRGIEAAVPALIDAFEEVCSTSITTDAEVEPAERLLYSGRPELVRVAKRWQVAHPDTLLDGVPEHDGDHYHRWGQDKARGHGAPK